MRKELGNRLILSFVIFLLVSVMIVVPYFVVIREKPDAVTKNDQPDEEQPALAFETPAEYLEDQIKTEIDNASVMKLNPNDIIQESPDLQQIREKPKNYTFAPPPPEEKKTKSSTKTTPSDEAKVDVENSIIDAIEKKNPKCLINATDGTMFLDKIVTIIYQDGQNLTALYTFIDYRLDFQFSNFKGAEDAAPEAFVSPLSLGEQLLQFYQTAKSDGYWVLLLKYLAYTCLRLRGNIDEKTCEINFPEKIEKYPHEIQTLIRSIGGEIKTFIKSDEKISTTALNWEDSVLTKLEFLHSKYAKQLSDIFSAIKMDNSFHRDRSGKLRTSAIDNLSIFVLKPLRDTDRGYLEAAVILLSSQNASDRENASIALLIEIVSYLFWEYSRYAILLKAPNSPTVPILYTLDSIDGVKDFYRNLVKYAYLQIFRSHISDFNSDTKTASLDPEFKVDEYQKDTKIYLDDVIQEVQRRSQEITHKKEFEKLLEEMKTEFKQKIGDFLKAHKYAFIDISWSVMQLAWKMPES